MAKKKRGGHEEHENAERWLLTYADMITLLMAFFIMMYSMSVMNLEKFNQVAFSIRGGFGGVLNGQGQHILKSSGVSKSGGNPVFPNPDDGEKTKAKKAANEIKDSFAMGKFPREVQVKEDVRGLVISIVAEPLLFKRGSAAVAPGDGRKIIDNISKAIAKAPNKIQVEGHTCNIPINTAQFPSNWDLSTARACSILRLLEKDGVNPGRCSAAGYADTRPVRENTSEELRALNRRVEIVLLNLESQRWSPGPNSRTSTGQPISPQRESVAPSLPKVWEKREQVEEEVKK